MALSAAPKSASTSRPMTRIDDHHGQHPRRVGQLAGVRQLHADRRAAGDDHEQLAGHQAAPRERPALLEARRRWPAARPARSRTGRASSPARRGCGRPAAAAAARSRRRDDAVGDRRRGAEDDHEEDRLSLSWNSRIASGNQAIDGIVCSAGDHRADRGPQHAGPGRPRGRAARPTATADAEADERPAQRGGQAVPERRLAEHVASSSSTTVSGAGQRVLAASSRTRPRSARPRRPARARRASARSRPRSGRPGRAPSPGRRSPARPARRSSRRCCDR